MFKQLALKLEEGAQFIAQEREKVTFNVNDTKEIEKWEQKMKAENQSPISSFYSKFIKVAAKNKDMLRQSQEGSNSSRKQFTGSKGPKKGPPRGNKFPGKQKGKGNSKDSPKGKNFSKKKQSGGKQFSAKNKKNAAVLKRK